MLFIAELHFCSPDVTGRVDCRPVITKESEEESSKIESLHYSTFYSLLGCEEAEGE